jgi:D-3-phosphoglycerate dehydrogenase
VNAIMIVLVADKFEESGIRGLAALGCVVRNEPDLRDAALADALRTTGAAVLIVRSTKVTAAMMAGSLKLIVRAGSGYDTIDVPAATARGILVANCPGKNAIAVAELAFGLMLAIDRRIPDNVSDLRAGTWNKKTYTNAAGLYGSTLGLLGAGHIGREMIRRAAGFGLPVVLWTRRFDGEDRALGDAEAEALGVAAAARAIAVRVAPSPEEVAARCDILSLHLALTPGTRHLVNASLLARLKPGSMLINTSRADIVDEDALRTAIVERHVRVGLDVYAREPSAASGAFDDPIVHLPGVYGTHHIGASTRQAQEAIAAETVRNVEAFVAGRRPPNVVN